MTRILLGSGGFRTAERRERLVQAMRRHFGDIERLLFVPYAGGDLDAYVQAITDAGLNAGYVLEGIHRAADPVAAIATADGIYVGGGNTFRLIDRMHRLGLVEPIRERVRAGVPYMGVSAGSNVACPTMMTTNDMPIVQPPSFEALGLVPFQLNAHYILGAGHYEVGGVLVKHYGETRDDRINEFHEENDTSVIGLWEGGLLWCVDGSVRLEGARARVFVKNREAVDVEPPAELDGLIVKPDGRGRGCAAGL